jgi:hypothetical protein
MRTRWLVSVVLFAGLMGCGSNGDVNKSNLTPVDGAVLSVAETVRDAAQAYLAANGNYADYPCADFVALLPGNTLLVNPVTGEATEPTFYEPAGVGSVSYRVFATQAPDGSRIAIGYYIVARGETQDFILTNVPDHSVHLALEAQTIANCRLVRAAAIGFAAENAGEYAVLESSTNLAGKTLMDYLPGGQKLVNPYTGVAKEPSIWYDGVNPIIAKPVFMGEIRYIAYDGDTDGTWSEGFNIEAVASYAPGSCYLYELIVPQDHEWEAVGADMFGGPTRPCVWP